MFDFPNDRTEGDVTANKRKWMRDTSTWLTCAIGLALSGGVHARSVSVSSPDHRIMAVLSDDAGALRYRIQADGKALLAPSPLGIRVDGLELGSHSAIGNIRRGATNTRYRLNGGKAMARNHANTATVSLTAHGRAFEADLHVADDGVAVRLRLPASKGSTVEADRSGWKLAENDPPVWATALLPDYENVYTGLSLRDLGTGRYGLPLTAHSKGFWITLSEAAVVDYGDLAIERGADGGLAGVLYADPQGWRTDAAVVQPWRVTIIARTLTDLVNSTLVQNLNPAFARAGQRRLDPPRTFGMAMAGGRRTARGRPAAMGRLDPSAGLRVLPGGRRLARVGAAVGHPGRHGAPCAHARRRPVALDAQPRRAERARAQGAAAQDRRDRHRRGQGRFPRTGQPRLVQLVYGRGARRRRRAPDGGFPRCHETHRHRAHLAQCPHPRGRARARMAHFPLPARAARRPRHHPALHPRRRRAGRLHAHRIRTERTDGQQLGARTGPDDPVHLAIPGDGRAPAELPRQSRLGRAQGSARDMGRHHRPARQRTGQGGGDGQAPWPRLVHRSHQRRRRHAHGDRSGIPEERTLEAHGTARRACAARCLGAHGTGRDPDWIDCAGVGAAWWVCRLFESAVRTQARPGRSAL
ncbi:hypothetical protein EI541_02960 [Xanthomonas citri pv. eucalyptorum]|nr:hypothetical protein EI541_02960 [Xanthomonas axonopodis pv. eucalyptorum]